MSDRIREPDSHGEVLELVLELASECFSRVAMFMVGDDAAVGMAQVGLARGGGPGDEALRRIRLEQDEMPEPLRDVMTRREAVDWVPAADDDRAERLAMLLGDALPARCFAAPVESGGSVVALLYADNLPHEAPFCDTTGIEIALHGAGLALDRAYLERSLSESGSE